MQSALLNLKTIGLVPLIYGNINFVGLKTIYSPKCHCVDILVRTIKS